MDLDIILWIGGMLFSLGIFAVKVGFGLGFSGIRWKGIFLTFSIYLVLFVLIAILSEQLMKMLEPILQKGPYLHVLMAIGMIAWGIILLRRQKTHQHSITPSLLLIIPCPVCLTAMTFSTWSALSVIKLPSAFVGLGLGIAFVLLSLILIAFARLNRSEMPEIRLGLSMIGIGLYFIASLFLPAKIEEAKGVYQSFIAGGGNIDINNSIGVFALLFAALVVGYLMDKDREFKR